LVDLVVDSKMLLEWILQKRDGMVSIEFVWLGIRTSGSGLSSTR